jgi:hypothetical protein
MRRISAMICGLFLLALVASLVSARLFRFNRFPLSPSRIIASSWNATATADTQRKPYTIFMTERLTEPKGMDRDGIHIVLNRTPVSVRVTAQRSDGSTYNSIAHPEAFKLWPEDKPFDDTEIIDVTKRRTVDLFYMLNSKTTYPFDEATATKWATMSGATPESDCLLSKQGTPALSYRNIHVAAREEVAGVDAVRLTADGSQESKGDYVVVTQWFAPSLECALIKSTITTTHPDGSFSLVENEPDKIIPGEPDPKLFSPQLDELKPSDSLVRRKQYFAHFAADHNCPTCLDPKEAERVAQKDYKYKALIEKYGPIQ